MNLLHGHHLAPPLRMNDMLGVVAHSFNPSTHKAEPGRSLEFKAKASLVYTTSSKTARAIQKPDLKINK